MHVLFQELRQHSQPNGVESSYLRHTREQILIALITTGASLGTLALLITLPSFIRTGMTGIFPIYASGVAAFWVILRWKQLTYHVRATFVLLCFYLLGVTELLYFGYTVDGHTYLIACTLFAALFFNPQVSRRVLFLNTFTIFAIGWLINSAYFVVWGFLFRQIDLSLVIGTTIIFFSIMWALQTGIVVLLAKLNAALQQERNLRNELEQRVIERTQELAEAHAEALATNHILAEQRQYLSVLYDTTLDLLNQHKIDDLLQSIVDRATTILDTPFGELMLREGDELVVRAYTANQPYLKDDRVTRNEAKLSWQACDSGQPVVLADYSAWSQSRNIYTTSGIRAVADFPIMAQGKCLGVLALGRVESGRHFTSAEINQGQLFSQLIALVLENANLYATAQREIAERTDAEHTLTRLAADLKAQNADLDAFGHMVAHDLKTPLSGITGYCQLLQISHRRIPPEAIDRYLSSILTSGQKMTTIINELLILSSVRRSAHIVFQPLQMAVIINDVNQRFAYQLSTLNTSLHLPLAWPSVLGHAPWVEEVWVNYVSNALKYGGTLPEVSLGFDPPAVGFVRFWVEDHGDGITPADQALLFKDFSRLQPARVDGHGLGLAITRRIVERMGGTVGVESSVGRGSIFWFTLPIAPAATPGQDFLH